MCVWLRLEHIEGVAGEDGRMLNVWIVEIGGLYRWEDDEWEDSGDEGMIIVWMVEMEGW